MNDNLASLREFHSKSDMKIATIVFDFGNVVGYFSHRKSAEQLAVYSHHSAESIQAHLYGGQLEEDYEAGKISSADFIAQARQACALTCTDEQFARAFADMFEPNPLVCEIIPLLKKRYRLLLLSNTNDLHYRQFSKQFESTLGQLHGVILSHVVGARKPSPAIYDAALALAGCPADQCLFIDDLPTNIAAAKALGWHGLVYRKGDDPRVGLAEFGITPDAPA